MDKNWGSEAICIPGKQKDKQGRGLRWDKAVVAKRSVSLHSQQIAAIIFPSLCCCKGDKKVN